VPSNAQNERAWWLIGIRLLPLQGVDRGGQEVDMSEPTRVEVTFPTGADVLGAYWGSIGDGGLVLPGLSVRLGAPIIVLVTIESSGKSLELSGRVVQHRGRASTGDCTYIAFDESAPHGLFLDLAWADQVGTSPRRYVRKPVYRVVSVSVGDVAPFVANLVNVSEGGCCVQVRATDDMLITTGDPVVVNAAGAPARGRVRWRSGLDLGVQFEDATAAGVLARSLG
jgi:hypothetical protein